MPRQFSPAGRDRVIETLQEMDTIYEVGYIGPGLKAVKKVPDNDAAFGVTMVIERCGWYLDTIIPKDGGDILIFMPITEVP